MSPRSGENVFVVHSLFGSILSAVRGNNIGPLFFILFFFFFSVHLLILGPIPTRGVGCWMMDDDHASALDVSYRFWVLFGFSAHSLAASSNQAAAFEERRCRRCRVDGGWPDQKTPSLHNNIHGMLALLARSDEPALLMSFCFSHPTPLETISNSAAARHPVLQGPGGRLHASAAPPRLRLLGARPLQLGEGGGGRPAGAVRCPDGSPDTARAAGRCLGHGEESVRRGSLGARIGQVCTSSCFHRSECIYALQEKRGRRRGGGFYLSGEVVMVVTVVHFLRMRFSACCCVAPRLFWIASVR